MRYSIFIIFICFLATACKTREKVIVATQTHTEQRDSISTRIDSTRLESHKTDSIYVHDSVFVMQRGDTVYIYKEKQIHEKSSNLQDYAKTRIDTMYIHTEIRDTIPFRVTEYISVKADPPKYLQFLAILGTITILYLFMKLAAWVAQKMILKK